MNNNYLILGCRGLVISLPQFMLIFISAFLTLGLRPIKQEYIFNNFVLSIMYKIRTFFYSNRSNRLRSHTGILIPYPWQVCDSGKIKSNIFHFHLLIIGWLYYFINFRGNILSSLQGWQNSYVVKQKNNA